MQIKWETHSYWTMQHHFKVNAVLVFLSSRVCFTAGAAFTEPVTFPVKILNHSQHPHDNHINLRFHQNCSWDRLSPIPEYHAPEGPGSPWNGWLTLNMSYCITRAFHLLFYPSSQTFHSSTIFPLFYTSSTLPSSFFYLVTFNWSPSPVFPISSQIYWVQWRPSCPSTVWK